MSTPSTPDPRTLDLHTARALAKMLEGSAATWKQVIEDREALASMGDREQLAPALRATADRLAEQVTGRLANLEVLGQLTPWRGVLALVESIQEIDARKGAPAPRPSSEPSSAKVPATRQTGDPVKDLQANLARALEAFHQTPAARGKVVSLRSQRYPNNRLGYDVTVVPMAPSPKSK